MDIKSVSFTKNSQSFGVKSLRFHNPAAVDKFALSFPTINEFEGFKTFLKDKRPVSGEDIKLLITTENGNMIFSEDAIRHVNSKSMDTFVSIPASSGPGEYKGAVVNLISKINSIREYTHELRDTLQKGLPLY